MRPAQLTPENVCSQRIPMPSGGRFNEAGAINAGKLLLGVVPGLRVDDASMRPAQLTPENKVLPTVPTPSTACFNEAGAINVGKHNRISMMMEDEIGLQ